VYHKEKLGIFFVDSHFSSFFSSFPLPHSQWHAKHCVGVEKEEFLVSQTMRSLIWPSAHGLWTQGKERRLACHLAGQRLAQARWHPAKDKGQLMH